MSPCIRVSLGSESHCERNLSLSLLTASFHIEHAQKNVWCCDTVFWQHLPSGTPAISHSNSIFHFFLVPNDIYPESMGQGSKRPSIMIHVAPHTDPKLSRTNRRTGEREARTLDARVSNPGACPPGRASCPSPFCFVCICRTVVGFLVAEPSFAPTINNKDSHPSVLFRVAACSTRKNWGFVCRHYNGT